jgi:hypothetical protein
MEMGLLAQNPSQSAAWLKPAWATFGKFGGSRQSTVEIALRWPENRTRTEISVRFHPWGAHTHTHRNPSPTGITLSINPVAVARLQQRIAGQAAPFAATGTAVRPVAVLVCLAIVWHLPKSRTQGSVEGIHVSAAARQY